MIRLFSRIKVVEPQIERQIRPDVTEKRSIAEEVANQDRRFKKFRMPIGKKFHTPSRGSKGGLRAAIRGSVHCQGTGCRANDWWASNYILGDRQEQLSVEELYFTQPGKRYVLIKGIVAAMSCNSVQTFHPFLQ
jgi:hypothetical protein